MPITFLPQWSNTVDFLVARRYLGTSMRLVEMAWQGNLHGLRVVPVEDGECDNEGGRDGEEGDESRANIPRHKTENLQGQLKEYCLSLSRC